MHIGGLCIFGMCVIVGVVAQKKLSPQTACAGRLTIFSRRSFGAYPHRRVGICPNRVGICPNRVGICPSRVGVCPNRVWICPSRVGICPNRVRLCPNRVRKNGLKMGGRWEISL